MTKNEQRLFDALESVLNELYWHENTIDDDGLWEAVEHAQGVLEGIAIEDADKS